MRACVHAMMVLQKRKKEENKNTHDVNDNQSDMAFL